MSKIWYTCDGCGNKFDHKPSKVYDENNNEQKGLVHCCMCAHELPDEDETEYDPSVQASTNEDRFKELNDGH